MEEYCFSRVGRSKAEVMVGDEHKFVLNLTIIHYIVYLEWMQLTL